MAASLAKPKKPKKATTYSRPNNINVNGFNLPGLNVQPTRGAPTPQPTAINRSSPAAASATPSPPNLITPPETSSGADIRNTATTTYQGALRTGRQGIVNAALRLGSPEVISALLANPEFSEYAAVLKGGLTDPSSQISQAVKDEGRGLQDIDTSANAGNTYFSSKRAENRDKLSDDYSTLKAGYLRDYNTGYSGLIGDMATAKGTYEDSIKAADRADRDAYLANEPQPSGPAAPQPPAAPVAPVNVPGVGNLPVWANLGAIGNPNRFLKKKK